MKPQERAFPSDEHIRAVYILLKQGISTLSPHLPSTAQQAFMLLALSGSILCSNKVCGYQQPLPVSLTASVEPCRSVKKQKPKRKIHKTPISPPQKQTDDTCLCSLNKNLCSVKAISLFIPSQFSQNLSADQRSNFCLLPVPLPPSFVNRSFSLVLAQAVGRVPSAC